jgi:catechol 2,3-dioxygenase-like lactoylglutathione lyase family enzyme
MPLLFLSICRTRDIDDPKLRVVNVVINSRKFTQSIEFYGQTLGWKPSYRDKTSCFFPAGGVNVVIVRAAQGTKPSSICLDLTVSSLAQTEEWLAGRGVRFDSRSESMATFHDPDGNLIEVVHG